MAVDNIGALNVSQNFSAVKWMSEDLMVVYIVLDVIILSVSVMGNFLVIFTIVHDKKLQTTCNFLLLHLAVSDLSLTISSIPFHIYALVNGGHWRLGNIVCKLSYPLCTVFYTSGALILTIISLDRYRVFVQTFKSKLRRSQAKKIVAIAYVISVAVVVPYAVTLRVEDEKCLENWSRIVYRHFYTVFLFSVQYALPLIIMLVVYSTISRILTRKMRSVNLSQGGSREPVSLYTNSCTNTRCERERERRYKKALTKIIAVVDG